MNTLETHCKNLVDLLFSPNIKNPISRFEQQKQTISKQRTYTITLLAMGISLLLIAGCGSTSSNENGVTGPLREARPTFTPTVAVQQAADSPAISQPQSDSSDSGTAASATLPPDPPVATEATKDNKPIVVITEELVNARNGPGLNFDLVEMVERGQQFDIIGKTPDAGWWKICCVDGQQAWVINQFVQTDGDTDSVTVISDFAPAAQAPAAQAPTSAPIATNPPPAAAEATATTSPPPAAAPALGFDLITQEQFPETNVVRVFLFVFEGSNALDGYTLRVLHNGTELPTSDTVSIGPQPGLTWPISDTRQRLQNYKVEFPGEQPGGTWDVQLMRDNQPVGPIATFKLDDNEKEREMYVRYQKK